MNEDYEEILISTPIDQMIQIIKEQGEVPLDYLALKLSLEPEVIEDWARILERDGIVELKYGLDKTIIRWNSPKKEEPKEGQAEAAEELPVDLKKEVEEEKAKLRDLMVSIEEEIKKLRKDQERAGEFLKVIGGFRQEVIFTVTKVEDDLEEVRKEVKQLNNALGAMEEMVKSYAPKELNDLIRESRENMERLEKEFREIVDRLKKERGKLESANIPSKEEILQIKNQLSEIKRKLPKLEVAKTTIDSIYEILENQDKVKREYEELKQGVAQLMEELNMLSGPLEEVEKKLAEIKEKSLEYQRRGAELNHQIAIQSDILHNLGTVITKTMVKELDKTREEVEEVEDKVEGIPDYIEDFSELTDTGKDRTKESIEEAERILGKIEYEFNVILSVKEISDGLKKEIEKVLKTIEEVKSKIARILMRLEEKSEKLNSIKEKVEEVVNSESFVSGLKALEGMVKRLNEITTKYDEVNDLIVELENLEKQLSLLGGNMDGVTREKTKKSIGKFRRKREKLEEWLKAVKAQD